MWLVTTRGFFSGVQDKHDPNIVVIRARTDRHLKALMPLLPEGTKIVTDEGTDYPCRVRVTAAEWIKLVAVLASEVDYTNFKDAVEDKAPSKAHGRFDHEVYLGVWSRLRSLTSARELKQRGRWQARRYRGHHGGDTAMAFDPWPADDPLRPQGRSERLWDEPEFR